MTKREAKILALEVFVIEQDHVSDTIASKKSRLLSLCCLASRLLNRGIRSFIFKLVANLLKTTLIKYNL